MRAGIGGIEGSGDQEEKGGGMSVRTVAILSGAVVCLLVAQMASRGQTPLERNKSNTSAPTVEEAKKYIEKGETELFELGIKASRASWVQETFITEDTEKTPADTNEVLNTASTKHAREAHRFDGLKLEPELARKRLLLELAAGFPAPNDPKAQKELADILSSLDGDYGKGKWCPDGERGECLDVTAVGKLMAESRNRDELKRAWLGWHAIGAPMRQRYARMVALGNAGARELGYTDVGALWRANYDMPPDGFAREEDRLWDHLKPLYLSLHAYAAAQR